MKNIVYSLRIFLKDLKEKINMRLYTNKLIQELPPELADEIPIKFYSSDKIVIISAKNVFSQLKAFDHA